MDDAIEIPTKALIQRAPALADRIAVADADSDGMLSLDEVVKLLQREQSLAQERRLMRRIAAVMAVSMLLLLFAVSGLTAGIIFLSKETSIERGSGAMLVKGDASRVVSTAPYTETFDVSDLIRSDPSDPGVQQGLQSLSSIMVEDGGRVSFMPVARVSLGGGSPPTVTTVDGRTFEVGHAGATEVVRGADGRRRLLGRMVQVSAVMHYKKPRRSGNPAAKPESSGR
jgi:hypothetical protein